MVYGSLFYKFLLITKKSMCKYDYLIVGSGLFGATFAYMAKRAGKSCLVIDKRPHLGGKLFRFGSKPQRSNLKRRREKASDEKMAV